jgi:hypothetical protein
MFANKYDNLSEEVESFEAADGSLTVVDGAAPLLLVPFWTGLPEARPVIGFSDDRVHAGGLAAQNTDKSAMRSRWSARVPKV